MSPKDVAPMVQPSPLSSLAFVVVTAFIIAAVVYAVWWTGRVRGDRPEAVARDVRRSLLASLAYLAVTAGVAASGLLEREATPPPLMLFLASTNLVALGVGLSPLGKRFAAHLPIAAIIGFQGFRLPLELILHRWYVEGVVPVTMTYAGSNFDIVSGILAIVVGLWAAKRRVPRWAIVGTTAIGLTLLVRVATIAVLSSPLPLRRYFEGPPVQLALHVPTVWIVPICVGGALAGHVVAMRWLRLHRR